MKHWKTSHTSHDHVRLCICEILIGEASAHFLRHDITNECGVRRKIDSDDTSDEIAIGEHSNDVIGFVFSVDW